jgi:hypothetical protein
MAKKDTKPQFKISIEEMIHQKILYLLRRFKSIEWSGPAWYEIVKARKNGFPEEVKLTYFLPIHLGSAAETELDGDMVGKLLPKVYKKMPELAKGSHYLGLIHSHHTMGAFLSGTDKETAREQSTGDGIFFSTVVASSGEPFDCCFTYRDRFGYSNLIEGEVEVSQPKIKIPKEWSAEARKIEKAKKEETKIGYTNGNQIQMYGNNYGYGYGYGGYNGYYNNNNLNVDLTEKDEKDKKKTSQYSWDRQTEVSEKEIETMMELIVELEDDIIDYPAFMQLATEKCPNVDPHLFMEELATGGFKI